MMALDNTKIKSKTTLDAVLVPNKLGREQPGTHKMNPST